MFGFMEAKDEWMDGRTKYCNTSCTCTPRVTHSKLKVALTLLSLSQIVIKDYALALFVVGLVVIDVIILGLFTMVEGLRGELGVIRTSNKENMEDTTGVFITLACKAFSTKEHNHFLLCVNAGIEAL